MLNTTSSTTYTIDPKGNEGLRPLIKILAQDLGCEDVFVYTNEDNDLGTIIIGTNGYAVETVKNAIIKVEMNLVDGFSDDYNMKSYELEGIKHLLDNIVLANENNRNGVASTLELA